jgi:hypothetical protein
MGRMGQAEQDRRIGKAELHSQKGTGRTGQAEQIRQNRKVKTGQA